MGPAQIVLSLRDHSRGWVSQELQECGRGVVLNPKGHTAEAPRSCLLDSLESWGLFISKE
jgi:hypothetical protein